jgi:penicillin-insensitive murein endopeptidase
MCERKFGVGNISVAGGTPFPPHKTHMNGIEMDCRPVRKDRMTGQIARCSFRDIAYDLVATIQLIGLFAKHPWVRIIFFNDIRVQQVVPGVFNRARHDDHFHVELKKGYAS